MLGGVEFCNFFVQGSGGEIATTVKIFILSVGMLVGSMYALGLNPSFAQEQEDTADESFAMGTVAKVSPAEITIIEYDYDADEEKEMSYLVNPETQFENVTSLGEIAPGDNVGISFKEIDGHHVAVLIAKELIVPDEEDRVEDGSADGGTDELTGNHVVNL